MGYISLPSILNATMRTTSYYFIIPKTVIMHDGIKTTQKWDFSVFIKKEQNLVSLKQPKNGFKKTKKSDGLFFFIPVFLNPGFQTLKAGTSMILILDIRIRTLCQPQVHSKSLQATTCLLMHFEAKQMNSFVGSIAPHPVFFAETFRSFSLRHFGQWNISVICLAVVWKLVITVFLACVFRHSDRNHLIFFGHFKNVSVYDQK